MRPTHMQLRTTNYMRVFRLADAAGPVNIECVLRFFFLFHRSFVRFSLFRFRCRHKWRFMFISPAAIKNIPFNCEMLVADAWGNGTFFPLLCEQQKIAQFFDLSLRQNTERWRKNRLENTHISTYSSWTIALNCSSFFFVLEAIIKMECFFTSKFWLLLGTPKQPLEA